MADAENVEQNVDSARGDEGSNATEPDYKALYEQQKADSRKWEQRAKANKAKADKLDELSAGNQSIEDRIAALEAENKAMRDAAARHALVSKVAKEVGLPESLVDTLTGNDEETLMAQAQAFAALRPKGAPTAPEAGTFPRDTAKKSASQQFGELLNQMLS